MIIRSAIFIKSSPVLSGCPEPVKPEFAFIGRSNSGKSSLINMLTGWSKLARTSSQPGKTQTINHFLINNDWYLVDLPGYGYAKAPVSQREKWTDLTEEYIIKRENLINLFVLLDPRHEPQMLDIELMRFLGINGIPFSRIFTKSDKLTVARLKKAIAYYDTYMLEEWESLPVSFITSAKNRKGREEILDYIEESINNLSNKV
jgi:GTP-binding protein